MATTIPPRRGATDDYNLARRIFTGTARLSPTKAGRSLESTLAAIAEAPADGYNLAARVYGARQTAGITPIETVDATAMPLRGARALARAAAMPAAVLPLVAPPAAAPPAAPSRGVLGRLGGLRTFDSLRVTNFRWYFISMLGVFGAMNMQMLVRGYVVFQLTGSYVALGTISLANAVPGLVLSLPGGVVADRIPKKLTQQIGNALNALNTISIALLIMFGMLRYEHLIANAIIQGIIQALMMPARQSMIPDIVLPKHIMNAVALNNVGMNISRMFMPALGGFIIAATHNEGEDVSSGASLVFWIMAGLYLFSVVTLIRVPSKPIDIPPEERIALPSRGRVRGGHGAPVGHVNRANSGMGVADLWDGLKYMVRDRTIGVILLVNFLMVLCSMPYMMMMPGFVKDVLHGDAGMQGALMSATSVGSLAAALIIASLPSRRRGAILIWGSFLLGLALIAFSASHWFWLTMPIMVFIGIGQSTRMALSNVLVQSYADDHYRGRVMSIYMMEMSLVQIGTFFVGLLAAAIGIQWALGLMSAFLVALALGTYAFSSRMRNLD
ncbi:MAG: MFS transporter [Dehalococcoidia bacterium]|nr:MFS transporter [Dehalococcoidia bacterium]